MKSRFLPQRGPLRFILWLTLTITLVACTIEGGVPEPTVVTFDETLPQPTDAAAAAAIAAREDTWAIGLQDQPSGLYPYPASPSIERLAAPVTEVLFPSPILTYNYGYTTTGVLEQIPTLENGGAELREADVYLDATGAITTTATEVLTQVQQLVVTFRWNPELRWSDGTLVTAQDSVFAYELARAAPPNAEAVDLLVQTLTYEAVDAHTTRATLQPDLTGVTYFLSYWTPLPRHLLEGVDPVTIAESDFARQPIGYGPYAIEERLDNEIRMVRNEHYFGATPPASRLVFFFQSNLDLLRANMLNGNLDAIATDRAPVEQFAQFDQDAEEGLLQVQYVSNPIWEHIDFNLDVRVLQDIRVRRAIAHGTNRQAMVDTLFAGRTPVLDSWVLPEQPEAAAPEELTRYDYNPDESRRLLEESGYVVADESGIRTSSEGITLSLQLLTTATPLRAEIAQQFTEDMRAIGIDVEVLEVSSDELFDPEGPLQRRQFEMALFGWAAAPNAGGLSLWSCNAVPSEQNGWRGENFSGWCFRDANRALLEGVTALDIEERRAAYLRQQQLWTQEMPSLPLFQRVSMALFVPNINGPQADSFAPITWNIADWRRE